jgi:O-succinylbenzoic acid--CoA ligase
MNKLVNLGSNDLYKHGTAFLICDKEISYSGFTEKVDKQAIFLYENGVRLNDVIPVISSNNSYFLISVFALWKLGAVPALINIRLTIQETEYLIDFIKPSVVLAESGKFAFPGSRIISGPGKPASAIKLPGMPADITRTALIIFTSGSTGKPKGVELSFANLVAGAKNANEYLEVKHGKSWLASLPFYHIGGFSIVIRALLSGSPVIMPASSSAENLCKAIDEYKPAYISLVSTQLKQLLDLNCNHLEGISKILLGGGFIDEELIKHAVQRGLNLVKGYGSTETASFISALNCSEGIKLNSSGKPVAGNEIKIVDENNNELPPGAAGEIVIKGKTVAKGYYKNPEAASEKFRNGYFYSGDIGYLDEEGYLFVQARRTDLIISGGENINPREVEQAILKYPGITEAVVIGIEDQKWGHTPAAVIVTNNTGITQQGLKQFLKNKLAGFKIPARIAIVNEIPKTSLGKVQREKLKELF